MERNKSLYRKTPSGGGSRKQSFVAPIVFLSLLAIVLAVSVGLLLRKALTQQETVRVTMLEKDALGLQKQELVLKLDSLDRAYDDMAEANTLLEQEIRAQQAEIRRLRNLVQQAVSPEELAHCVEQMEAMGREMALLSDRIRLLEEENRTLSGENVQFRSALSQATVLRDELQEANREMSEQIERAGRLEVASVEVVPLRETRRGDRETTRATRAGKLRICFVIRENQLARTGEHEFYFQILCPDNEVMGPQPPVTLPLNGQETAMSFQEAIRYGNQQQETCVVFKPEDGFEKGTYQLRLFTADRELWRGLFALN
jgi:hypothetical protein